MDKSFEVTFPVSHLHSLSNVSCTKSLYEIMERCPKSHVRNTGKNNEIICGLHTTALVSKHKLAGNSLCKMLY